MKGTIALGGLLAAVNCQIITLGPQSNYDQPPAPSVTASGNRVEIFPEDFSNGVPPEGIDVAFGPEVRAAIAATLNGVCANGYSQECSNELSRVIDNEHAYTVESRVVGIRNVLVAAGALGVAILSVIIEAILSRPSESGATPLGSVHIPASDISQIQSQTPDASSVVIAMDATTVTITPAPTPTTTPATFTTLTADQNGHKIGDIVISLPTPAAQMLEQLIYKSELSSECVNIQMRKRQTSGGNFQAINDVVDYALPFVPPQHLLNGLGVELNQRLPRLIDEAQQASLAASQAFAAGLAEFSGLSPEFRNVLVETVWLGVVTWCADQVTDLTELVLQAGDYEEGNDDDPDDDTDECPALYAKDAPLCRWETCQGGTEGICSTGEYEGCECIHSVTPYWTPGSRAEWDAKQFMLQGLLSELGWGCSFDDRITLDEANYHSLAEAFCKDVDLTTTIEKIVSAADVGFPEYEKYEQYTFKFSWTKKGDEICMGTCTDIYLAFATDRTDCRWDPYTQTSHGYQDFTCGTAMFNITREDQPTEPPEDSEGTYVNQGLLNCGARTDQGNANYFTTLETIEAAAAEFCQKQVDDGLRWTPGEVAEDNALREINHNLFQYDPMYVSARWVDSPGCPTTDFSDGDDRFDMCMGRFRTIINECDTSSNGNHWWKQGGTFFRDCIEWEIKRDDFRMTDPGTEDDWRPNTMSCQDHEECAWLLEEKCGGGWGGCYHETPYSWCRCGAPSWLGW